MYVLFKLTKVLTITLCTNNSSVVAAAEYPKIRDAEWSIQILS